MTDSNLIHYITAWGTRKHCNLDELIPHYGTLNISDLFNQLERMKSEGKIEVNDKLVYLKRPA